MKRKDDVTVWEYVVTWLVSMGVLGGIGVWIGMQYGWVGLVMVAPMVAWSLGLGLGLMVELGESIDFLSEEADA